jgi:glycosyltransferase involved in cell wall biosynthesis
MRYVYIKNGDAVEQARRVVAGAEDRSGPDAFIGGFMHAHREEALLILCRWQRRDYFAAANVRAQSYPAGVGALGRAWARLSSMLGAGVAILRWRPQRIVCGCTGEMLWISVLAAKLMRVPIVCTRHSGLLERRGAGGIVSTLDRICIRACHAVASHGPFLAAEVAALGVPPSRIHEFDVDLRGFGKDAVPLAQGSPGAEVFARFPLVFMYVGRIQAGKGALDLLDAFCRLRSASGVDAALVYVGKGDDLESLERAVVQRGVSSHVKLLGGVPHASVPTLMQGASVIVAPTRPELVEGRCMVALEAQVLGVPVIGPRFAAFPYVIEHGVNGLLFTPGDVEALTRALLEVATDPQKLATLRAGASRSGQQLLAHTTTFAAAVAAGFAEARQ